MSPQCAENPLTWLDTPPTSQFSPPVETKKQLLPFGDLKWEDFERLCYRMARLEADIEHCQLYGIRGQKQEGIDIYAKRRQDSKYTVYQCKREDNFGSSKIESAVSKFIEGDWVGRTDTIVLCTKESLERRERADEIEKQRSRLNEKNIKLETWDCTELSTKLKSHPKIVDDFFGRPWVVAFFGKDEADKLGKRLDVEQVALFRQSFARFYKNIFNNHDPGLLISSQGGANSLALEDRYVVPDVNEWRNINIFPSQGTDDRPSTYDGQNEESAIKKPFADQKQIRQRQAIESWLAGSSQSIVLGGPGSGKSTLLRFIAMDLLSESPRLALLAKKWGQFLPVWVPFALWTRMISKSSASCSLSELLNYWLKNYNEERLYPLIEQALYDERLLLLVDGLDEWTNENAATVALDRLQVFIKQRNSPAIITSRPSGFRRLGGKQDEWQIGELSDFSLDQQRSLSNIWFAHRIKAHDETCERDEIERLANIETDRFISELNRSKDLKDLARVPLLLCLLIYHKVNNARLPQNRFKAYDSLVEEIIQTHPQKRKVAASLPDSSIDFSDEEIKKIFSLVAYHMHEYNIEGTMDQMKAVSIVEDYLKDAEKGLGISQRESHRLSCDLLKIGENSIGILAMSSPTEIRFFHRVFQEFLASYYLSSLSLEDRITIIKNHCADPQWKDTILGLFYITACTEDVGKFIEAIKEKLEQANTIEQYTIELLLAEAAFGDFNCSPALARMLARETFSQVELGLWAPHREDLLHCILDGLRSTKVKELGKQKIREWFPCRTYSRNILFDAMVNWPIDETIVECMWRGLRDEEIGCQRAAARALARIKKGDSNTGDKIESLARRSTDLFIRVSAIEALLKGWQEQEGLPKLLEIAGNSSILELRLIAILGKIEYNNQTEEDLNELIRLSSNGDRLLWRLDEWNKDIIDAFIRGWPQSEKIKRTFLQILRNRKHIMYSRDAIAVNVLLKGYPQDADVARFFAELITKDEHVFYVWGRNENPLDIMTRNFKNNEIIVSAIDQWLSRQKNDFEIDVTRAALVGCTEISKSKLFDIMKDSRFIHWQANALVEGWGMQDQAVAQKLKDLVSGPAGEASSIAHLLPKIEDDKEICLNKLMELLKDPDCRRPDFVLAGLKKLNIDHNDNEIIDFVLNSILNREDLKDYVRDSTMFELFSLFPSDNRIKELAKRELSTHHPNYLTIAWTLGNDEEIRRKITEIVCPLPASFRMIIAERMEDAGDDEFALSLLGLYDQEIDEEVKTQASIAYHKRLKFSGSNISDALDILSKSINCSGPGLESDRAAAFCGLVYLNRLDIVANCKETKSENPCLIPIRDYAPNIPLIRTILQKWIDIKEALGPEMLKRFTHWHNNDTKEVWNALCILADEYPLPCDDALEFLESHTERVAESNTLSFLSRTKPGSKLLRNYCLGSFYANQSQLRLSQNDEAMAAKLLGSQFKNNEDIFMCLHQRDMKMPLDSKLIIALCEGWPESKELDEMYNYYFKNKPKIGYEPYFYLISTKGSRNIIYDSILAAISHIDSESENIGPLYTIIPPLLRCLRNDDLLVRKLIDHLKANPTPSEKVIFTKIISDAVGVPSELKAWCQEELQRQFNETEAYEIGNDLSSGKPKAVINALLEVLSQSSKPSF